MKTDWDEEYKQSLIEEAIDRRADDLLVFYVHQLTWMELVDLALDYGLLSEHDAGIPKNVLAENVLVRVRYSMDQRKLWRGMERTFAERKECKKIPSNPFTFEGREDLKKEMYTHRK